MERKPDDKASTDVELAGRLGVEVATVRAWRLRGCGPTFHRFVGGVRYLERDIRAFIRRSAVEPGQRQRRLGNRARRRPRVADVRRDRRGGRRADG